MSNFGSISIGGVPVLPSGTPITGNVIYCDPGNLLPPSIRSKAYKWTTSLATAYGYTRSGCGDVVFLVGGPTAAGTTGQTARLTSTLTWANHRTHLVGIGAATRVGQRARITGPSTGGTFSPIISVTASGCEFSNFSLFDDYTVDPVALKVSGSRNLFYGVDMGGMGIAAGSADTAAASLWIAGGSENTFVRCTIGLDTVARSAANAEILLTSAATRNIFEDCDIISYCSSASHLFVKAANSGDLDRYTKFIRCRFTNMPTGIASGTTMTQAMNIHASAGGFIELYDCSLVGATDWAAADNGNVFAYGSSVTAGTVGLAAAVTR